MFSYPVSLPEHIWNVFEAESKLCVNFIGCDLLQYNTRELMKNTSGEQISTKSFQTCSGEV